jgi:hypothetical protein
VGAVKERATDSVAIAEGRLIAWVPGAISNPMNGAQRGWQKKARIRKGWRERTMLCVQDAMNRSAWEHRPLSGAVVVMTAYVWKVFDEDGLASALKPVMDGLVDARLLAGDAPRFVQKVQRRQMINRKHRGVEVVVQVR